MQFFRIFVVGTMCLGAASAAAQPVPSSIPSQAEPGRVFQQLELAPAPVAEPIPALDTRTPPARIPKDARGVAFVLKNVDIQGARRFSAEELRPLYASMIGQKIKLAEMYVLAARITQYYRERGYVLSKALVPSQKIVGGTVRLQVVEGYISHVELAGDYEKSSLIQEIVDELKQSKPLDIATLERGLLLLNDLPGIHAKGVLLPQENTKDGGVGLGIYIAHEPFVNNLSFDKLGSRYLGPYQAGVRVGSNHLVAPYHQTIVNAFASVPPDELRFAALSHFVPLTGDGLSLTLNGSYNETDPGYTLEELEVEGISYGTSMQLNYPLIRSRTDNLYASGTLDFRHSETDILATELFNDNTRAVRAGLSYDGTDRFRGTNLLSAEVSQGLDIFGASDAGDFNISRAEGRADFTKLTATAARLQGLTDSLGLYVATSGQVASSALLSAEEFGYGGSQFGRAYDSSEITGDHGLAGLVELRYSAPPLTSTITAQPYLFYDAGKVWNEDTGSEPASGTSAGAGVRFNYDDLISGDLYVAQPLTRPVSAPDSSDPEGTRVFFSLNMRF
jgi:hemolysin activation/secretion protein